jgi:glycerophosphoryl diester phosphodiesterase
VGLLFAEDQPWERRLRLGSLLGPRSVHPQASLCTAARIAAWRRAGLAVCPWTVDDPAEVERLARAGADALISNAPGAAREVVRRLSGR